MTMTIATPASLFQPGAQRTPVRSGPDRRIRVEAAAPVRRADNALLASIPPAARSRLTVRAQRLLRADY